MGEAVPLRLYRREKRHLGSSRASTCGVSVLSSREDLSERYEDVDVTPDSTPPASRMHDVSASFGVPSAGRNVRSRLLIH